MKSPLRILLVDDDSQSLDSTRKILELAGYEVQVARDGQEALGLVRPGPDSLVPSSSYDAIVTDVRMPHLSGLDFLKAYSLLGAGTPVILMTAFGEIEEAVWAMKLGAVDFLTKPFKRQVLLQAVESAVKRARPPSKAMPVVGENTTSSSSQKSSSTIIGASHPILELKAMITQVAPTTATVLISGESGTGKELVAREIHAQSSRSQNRFVALNCAALPENLIESELFGHEKGAFTGATSSRSGLFELAHGGTLLLDEIGDMPLVLQAKLLRVLQEGEVRRVGALESKKIDVRVIAASHQDLPEQVKKNLFREDLLFRLEVISLRVPSLRERMSDVFELAHYFLKQASLRHAKEVNLISGEALEILERHSWPGNVRELANVIERSVVFAQSDTLEVRDLPPHLVLTSRSHPSFSGMREGSLDPQVISVRLGTPLKDVEDLLIRKTLEATDGDKNMTARLLGINQRTIYRKLEEKKPE